MNATQAPITATASAPIQTVFQAILTTLTTTILPNQRVFLFLFTMIFAIVAVVLYFVYSKRGNSVDELALIREEQKPVVNALVAKYDSPKGKRLDPSKYGMPWALSQLEPSEQYLINMIPLTVRLPGYLGPNTPEGTFNEEEGVRLAILAGARAFFIPITTYVDVSKTPPLFPRSGDPAIIARTTAGTFNCKNGGFLKPTIDAIVKHKDDLASSRDDPILLILHQDTYVPSRSTNESFYLEFVRKVATAMESVRPFLVGQVAQIGETQKGMGGNSIFKEVPIRALNKKIIVLTNIDTRVEQNPRYGNATKLSDFVNSYYKTTADTTPGPIYSSLSSLIGATADIKEKSRVNFTMMEPLPTQLPTEEDMKRVVEANVQCVPIDLMSQANEATPIWNSWGGRGWRVKEKSGRFMKPADVVPQKPSAKLNARIEGTQYPGQLLITQ